MDYYEGVFQFMKVVVDAYGEIENSSISYVYLLCADMVLSL